VKIRRGKLSDLKELMKFLNDAPELSSGSAEETYSKSYVKACLQDKNRDLVLIAEDRKKIIGFLMAELWQKKKNSFFLDLFVVPEFRERGIANRLREEYENILKKLKIDHISCLVLLTNKKMQKHVEKRGFKRGHKFYYYEKEL